MEFVGQATFGCIVWDKSHWTMNSEHYPLEIQSWPVSECMVGIESLVGYDMGTGSYGTGTAKDRSRWVIVMFISTSKTT